MRDSGDYAGRGPSAPPSTAPAAAPPIAVRLATPCDVHRIVPLFDAYRVFYGRDSDRAAADAFLSARLSRDESVVLLATRPAADGADADVVGFAQLYRSFSSVSLGRTVILNDLYVVPSARRLGVGRCLVDAATTYARHAGAVRLELATGHENEAALRLYHTKGFVADPEFTHLSLALG